MTRFETTRRNILKQAAALAGGLFVFNPTQTLRAGSDRALRVIPSSGEAIPAVGMGSWITFNVGDDPLLLQQRTEVLRSFFALGGKMIDSSPMYGSAEKALGHCLDKLGADAAGLFAATKVWTRGTERGLEQIEESHRLWGISRFDLQQVHNLVNWREHLANLQQMKADRRLRYVGITTSHGRRHDELEKIMRSEAIDFVQLTYHLDNRTVESRLLPLAQEKGIAVIVNRPFSGGRLFDRYQDKPLPAWASEFDCQNWAQFFLKFVISHPAVTCAIPATSRVEHMIENMGALTGRLPDTDQRRRMLDYLRNV